MTSASTSRISPSVIGSLCEKSNRVLSASTSEPFCCTCGPSTRRSAACMRCVAEWFHIVRARAVPLTAASTLSPTRSFPVLSAPLCPNTSGWIFCVSSTTNVPFAPASSPRSPTWPPDSA